MDQAEVLDRKRSKLPKELPNSENVIYVPIDFAHQSLTENFWLLVLIKQNPLFLRLEGVSQYITKEAFNSTMKEIATLSQNANSIFSYLLLTSFLIIILKLALVRVI